MKNILQIVESLGIELTEEQKQGLEKGVSENYKTISDYQKQVKKTETAEAKTTELQGQLDDANETMKKFDGVDVEGYKKQIEDYKKRAEDAEAEADRKISERDQRDWLKAKLGAEGYDVKSARIRKSLEDDVIGGRLKWDAKTGQFFGFDDFMKAEKEADPTIYETKEEKEEKEKKDKAQGNAPRFTEPSAGDAGDNTKPKPVPKIW